MFEDAAALTRALGELGRRFPLEMQQAVLEATAKAALPVARSHTPKGVRTPHLRDLTTVVPTPRGAALVNKAVYANTIHWGRITNRSKYGKQYVAPVEGSRFAYDAVNENPAFDAALQRSVDRLADKFL